MKKSLSDEDEIAFLIWKLQKLIRKKRSPQPYENISKGHIYKRRSRKESDKPSKQKEITIVTILIVAPTLMCVWRTSNMKSNRQLPFGRGS